MCLCMCLCILQLKPVSLRHLYLELYLKSKERNENINDFNAASSTPYDLKRTVLLPMMSIEIFNSDNLSGCDIIIRKLYKEKENESSINSLYYTAY